MGRNEKFSFLSLDSGHIFESGKGACYSMFWTPQKRTDENINTSNI